MFFNKKQDIFTSLKKISTLITLGLMLLFLITQSACKKENRWDCLKLTGDKVSAEFTLEAFNEMTIEDNIQVEIQWNNNYSATIEAGENLIDLIEIEQKENHIFIRNKNKCNFMRSYKPEITVKLSVPFLTVINHLGYGSILGKNELTNSHLEIYSFSMGDVNLTVNGGFVYLYGQDGAHFNLKGRANRLQIYLKGTGIMKCENLVSEEVLLSTESTGDTFVHVERDLDITISGKGNVYYYGTPSDIEKVVTGEGQVIKLK